MSTDLASRLHDRPRLWPALTLVAAAANACRGLGIPADRRPPALRALSLPALALLGRDRHCRDRRAGGPPPGAARHCRDRRCVRPGVRRRRRCRRLPCRGRAGLVGRPRSVRRRGRQPERTRTCPSRNSRRSFLPPRWCGATRYHGPCSVFHWQATTSWPRSFSRHHRCGPRGPSGGKRHEQRNPAPEKNRRRPAARRPRYRGDDRAYDPGRSRGRVRRSADLRGPARGAGQTAGRRDHPPHGRAGRKAPRRLQRPDRGPPRAPDPC